MRGGGYESLTVVLMSVDCGSAYRIYLMGMIECPKDSCTINLINRQIPAIVGESGAGFK